MQKEYSSRFLNLTSRVKQALNSGRVYSSCSDLPLFIFIKVSVTSDLRHLKINGRPSKRQLEEAWENIFEEYTKLSKDTTSSAVLGCMKDIAMLKTKLALIQEIVLKMANRPNEGFANLLKGMGFRFDYDPTDHEKYMNDLKLTISQSKTYMVRIKDREKDLADLKSNGGEVKESDYDDLLGELSKFQGYALNAKEITVATFISVLNRFKKANNPNKK